MQNHFAHGYALLIGVGKTADSRVRQLPATIKDIQALNNVLIDQNYCAYLNDAEHIRLLQNEQTTRSAILDGLAWLKEKAAKVIAKLTKRSPSLYNKSVLLQISFVNIMFIPIIKEHIEITPGVCGGKPRIVGHRIRVQDIVIWHEQMGMSPDEILHHYPSISLADVYAALAYYHDHREEIQQQITADEEYARQLQQQNPSLLQQKLKHL